MKVYSKDISIETREEFTVGQIVKLYLRLKHNRFQRLMDQRLVVQDYSGNLNLRMKNEPSELTDITYLDPEKQFPVKLKEVAGKYASRFSIDISPKYGLYLPLYYIGINAIPGVTYSSVDSIDALLDLNGEYNISLSSNSKARIAKMKDTIIEELAKENE